MHKDMIVHTSTSTDIDMHVSIPLWASSSTVILKVATNLVSLEVDSVVNNESKTKHHDMAPVKVCDL